MKCISWVGRLAAGIMILAITYTAHAEEARQPLRIALTAAWTTPEGYDKYQQLVGYIGKRLGTKAIMLTDMSYDTISKLIKADRVDIALICGYPYVLLRDDPAVKIKLVAAPVGRDSHYQGKPIYYSYLLVRKDAPYRQLEDLKGKVLAYNEVTSNSGYNMPRHRLLEKGYTQGFFSSLARSGGHDESILMVSEGKADAAFVDSLVYDYAISRGDPAASQLHPIERLGPQGAPPVVLSARAFPLQEKLEKILVGMSHDKEGIEILKGTNLAGFAPVTDQDYEGIRKLHQEAQAAKFMEIR